MYLTKEIKENQQKYFQHVFRMFKDHIFRKLLHNKPYGRKRPSLQQMEASVDI